MDNKLWIFADSFGAEPNPAYDFKNNDDWIWWKQVAERMNLHAMSCSNWGISNEWLYSAMRTEYQNMIPGDKVVLITTDPNRRWFFEDLPTHANLWNRDIEKDVGKTKAQAVKQYLTHLTDNPILSDCYHETLIGWAYTVFNSMDVTVCAIPGFINTPMHVVGGSCLSNASNAEFASKEIMDYHYSKHSHRDSRICHFSRDNHTVLADKIVKFFKDPNQKMDLSTGFVQNIFRTTQDCDEFDYQSSAYPVR
tara:strand:- start:680 stop:1432 length:753 start_codon:yes stop_codon:yes gene_type:complete